MTGIARVIWSEGMHLAQHHFQAQNAYFEQVAALTTSALFHAPYGLLQLQLDEEALLSGTVVLPAAQGVMPDGVPFSFPEEKAPEPLRLADMLSPAQPSRLLHLALPRRVPGRANVIMTGGGSSARFSVEERQVPDETTGADARPVQFARKNFRLALDGEVTDEEVSLPIARIVRDRAGRLRYDREYTGPVLVTGASRYLTDLIARTLSALETRAESVAAERAAAAQDRADYAPREVAGFWFLHALNATIPVLRHWRDSGRVHPEQLYLCLAQLAGALCTFSLHAQADDIPAYDHDNPEPCFATLDREIQRQLNVFLPSAPVRLALQPGEKSFYTAPIEDARCLDPAAAWFLGVRCAAPPRDVVTHVKVCSARVIGWLAQKAFSGLTLEHLPVPPAELSPRVGMHYFALQRTDPCWQSIVETRQVGLYLPAAVGETELDLRVIVPAR